MYKMLSATGNPKLSSFTKLIHGLGLKFKIETDEHHSAAVRFNLTGHRQKGTDPQLNTLGMTYTVFPSLLPNKIPPLVQPSQTQYAQSRINSLRANNDNQQSIRNPVFIRFFTIHISSSERRQLPHTLNQQS